MDCVAVSWIFLTYSIAVQGSQYGSHFEGDIAVRRGESIPKGNVQSAFISNKKLRWSQTVQFSIGEDMSAYTSLIVECLQWIADRSCLVFQEGSTGDHIKFTSWGDKDNSGEGCWSYFGRQGGQQAVNLEIPSCLNKATVIHEIFHALGKVHEQSRPDRGDHVEILFDNIKEEEKHNFEIKHNVDPAGTSYDILSIMHYSPDAFSKNGKPTIIAKGGGGIDFGKTEEPTATDVYELNVAYQCEAINEEDNTDNTDDGYEYATNATVFYEDYENVYSDYGNLSHIIDFINTQFKR